MTHSAAILNSLGNMPILNYTILLKIPLIAVLHVQENEYVP